MNYKVLIVDDERWIYELLQRLINWNAFGFEIVGYATNGYDAYNFICEQKLDLVISDIRIPKMDGIELVKMVRARNINVHFILISGYQQFEYAQNALKYKVDDYLLKPIEEKELEAILSKISNELRNEDSHQRQVQNIMLKLGDNIKQLRMKTFENLLFSDSQTKPGCDEININCEMHLVPGYFQVSMLRLDIDKSANDDISGIMHSKIENVIDSYSHPVFAERVILHMNDFLVLILNYSNTNQLSNYYKSVFNKVSQLLNAYTQMTVTLSIGDPVDDIKTIIQSYDSAKRLMRSRVIFGGNRVIEANKTNYSPQHEEDLMTSDIKASLSNSFELLDFEKSSTILNDIFQHISRIENIDPDVVYTVLNQILKCLFNAMERLDHNDYTILSSFSMEEEFSQCIGMKALFKKFLSYVSETLHIFSEQRKKTLSKPIEQAKRYIRNYYNKQLPLADIARNVYLNEQYLSELFKKETGKTVTDYIRDYRIDVAKIFLNDNRYKINDIAEMVGYSDARHFSKIFKKVVGVTPKEYRQLGI